MLHLRVFLGLLLSVSVLSVSNAQITISEADVLEQVPGSFVTDVYWTCTFEPLVCDEQTGLQTLLDIDGADQTWDFTSVLWAELDTENDVIPFEYLAMPAGLPADNDPRVADATFVRAIRPQSDSLSASTYFATTPTQHLGYGTYEINNGLIYDGLYDRPMLEYPLPLIIGSAWDWQTTWTDNNVGIPLDVTLDLIGSVTGWGTIITPVGTFQALRVNREWTVTGVAAGLPPIVFPFTNVEFLTKDSLLAVIQILPDPLRPGSNVLLGSYQVTRDDDGGDPPTGQIANQQPPDGFQFQGDPELSWDSLPEADTYDIQISTDPLAKGSGNPIVVDEKGLTATSYTPEDLDANATYYWRVRGVNAVGSGPWSLSRSFVTVSMPVSVDESILALPDEFVLHQNYPNPFNPATTIQIDLPETAIVTLAVYDVLGHVLLRLESGTVSAGQHRYEVDASMLPSGVYLYRLETPAFSQSRRMILLK